MASIYARIFMITAHSTCAPLSPPNASNSAGRRRSLWISTYILWKGIGNSYNRPEDNEELKSQHTVHDIVKLHGHLPRPPLRPRSTDGGSRTNMKYISTRGDTSSRPALSIAGAPQVVSQSTW